MKNCTKWMFVVLLASTAVAQTTVYTSEAAFLAAIASPYYLEDFNGIPVNTLIPEPWDAPGGAGYDYVMVTEGTGATGLWGNAVGWPAAPSMSNNSALNLIRTNFTAFGPLGRVNAIGGYFASTDINGNPIAQDCTITLSNGFSHTINGVAFRGFVTSDNLTWFKVDGVDTPAYNWPAIDHLYVGVPEPASLALLALGLLLRRR